MKNNSLTNRILHFAKIFIIRYSIFNCVLFFVACDFTMVKELDIELIGFQPKLSVTSILNGGSGIIDIRLMEGTSLAEPYYHDIEIIRNGEIRLYEDGELILSIPGPFDMSRKITNTGDGWNWGQNGYRYVTDGMNTRQGSIYRLEADIEGYPMAVSSSEMPVAPVVSASMDTSVQVIRRIVKEITGGGYFLSHLNLNWGKLPEKYWPFSVRVDVAGENNYFILDIIKYEHRDGINRGTFWGLGGSDVSIFLEYGMDSELFKDIKNVDLYLFSMLMTNDFSFSGKDATRHFYTAVPEIQNNQEFDDSYLVDHPDIEKITIQHSLTLRVRNITPATYQFYRSLSLQVSDTGVFSEQPTSVVSNIEGGYGSFAVYNTTSIPLLEWETYEYREKEE